MADDEDASEPLIKLERRERGESPVVRLFHPPGFFTKAALRYEGQVKNGGIRHGRGKSYNKRGGLEYDGEWKNDKYDGQGTFHDKSGEVFTGEWAGGLPRCVRKNGLSGRYIVTVSRTSLYNYVGEVNDGLRHGRGMEFSIILVDLPGAFVMHGDSVHVVQPVYEGGYKNNARHGHGKLYSWCGDVLYDGEWEKGKRHGRGKEYDSNGKLTYEGEWKDGRRARHGTAYHSNGDTSYDGEWKDGERHGHGKMYHYLSGGNIMYDGEWKDGERHGHGKMYYLSGEIMYEGEWKNGKRDGRGKEYHSNGNTQYDGEWKNGRHDGHGKSYYGSGDVMYDGEWKNGKHHGNGKSYYPGGQVECAGVFEHGTLSFPCARYARDGGVLCERDERDDTTVRPA